MAQKSLFVGMLVIALTFGFTLASCGGSGGGGGSTFDGTTIAGTMWVGESKIDLSSLNLGKGTGKLTLSFSSDTAGTLKAEVSDWGTITDAGKGLVYSMLGTFTLSNVTYNATAKTGAYAYTMGNGALSFTATFTVDFATNKLTAVQIKNKEDTETVVYSLM